MIEAFILTVWWEGGFEEVVVVLVGK